MKLLSWNVGLAGPIFRKFMCIFDSKMVHRGVSSTNKKQRVVVNFNYEGN